MIKRNEIHKITFANSKSLDKYSVTVLGSYNPWAEGLQNHKLTIIKSESTCWQVRLSNTFTWKNNGLLKKKKLALAPTGQKGHLPT